MIAGRWLLTLAALGLALASFHRPPTAAHAGAPLDDDARTALIQTATERASEGDHTSAVALLREALERDKTSAELARLIRDIHDEGDLEPRPDEDAIDDVMRDLPPGFRRTETSRFVILSNADIDWTRQRERLLERTYHEVMKFAERAGIPAVPPERKLLVILFGDHADYRAFALEHDGVDAGWVAGYYAAVPNHAVFYDDRTSPAFREARAELEQIRTEARAVRHSAGRGNHPTPEVLAQHATDLEDHVRAQTERLDEHAERTSLAKTTHEATHLIAFNTGIQHRSRHYPFWITEGLAICFETDNPDRSFGPGLDHDDRRAAFDALVEDDALVPLTSFVARTEAVGPDADTIRAEYAQAWALFKDAARYEREALVGLLADIARAPAGRMPATEHLRMFERRFGDPARHQRAWLRRQR